MNDAGCDFGKFDSADVNRLDEKLPVFRRLLILLVLGFLELLLEEQNDLLDITAGSKAKDNVDGFPADFQVSRAGEDLEDVHDEGVDDMTVLGAEGVETVEDDELGMVVRLLLDKTDVARCGGCVEIQSEQRDFTTNVYVPVTAAGFWVRDVRVVAASYLTACEDALRSSEMRRTLDSNDRTYR